MSYVQVDADLFSSFAFYATILILKTMLMSVLTSFYRIRKGVFASEEDTRFGVGGNVRFGDEHVERIRRAHRNDMENIYTFVMLGAFYCMLGKPELSCAEWHFRIFTLVRIFHTLAYVGRIPQPVRGITWFAGWIVSVSMGAKILANTCPNAVSSTLKSLSFSESFYLEEEEL